MFPGETLGKGGEKQAGLLQTLLLRLTASSSPHPRTPQALRPWELLTSCLPTQGKALVKAISAPGKDRAWESSVQGI